MNPEEINEEAVRLLNSGAIGAFCRGELGAAACDDSVEWVRIARALIEELSEQISAVKHTQAVCRAPALSVPKEPALASSPETAVLVPVKTGPGKDEVIYINPKYITSIKRQSPAHAPAYKYEMWVVGHAGYGTFSVWLQELPEFLINRMEKS